MLSAGWPHCTPILPTAEWRTQLDFECGCEDAFFFSYKLSLIRTRPDAYYTRLRGHDGRALPAGGGTPNLPPALSRHRVDRATPPVGGLGQGLRRHPTAPALHCWCPHVCNHPPLSCSESVTARRSAPRGGPRGPSKHAPTHTTSHHTTPTQEHAQCK